MIANQMQGGVQTWYTLNSSCGFKFMLTTIAKFLIFIRMHAYRSLIMRFYSFFFFDNFFGWKILVFVEKVLLISYLMQVLNKKKWFS